MNVEESSSHKGNSSGQRVAKSDILPGISRAKAFFLLAAGLSLVMSVALFFTGSREQGIYVGIWVPSILSAGALITGKDGTSERS